jgi:hypothetical protein
MSYTNNMTEKQQAKTLTHLQRLKEALHPK